MTHVPEAAEYYTNQDIADLLGQDWTITVPEERPRPNPAPAGTHHTRDEVLRALRHSDLEPRRLSLDPPDSAAAEPDLGRARAI